MLALRPFAPRASITLGLTLALAAAWLAPPRPAAAQDAPPAARKKADEKKTDEKKAAAKKDAGPVDLNSAPLDELTTLPGIGEAFARKIIDNRPHKSVEDLAAQGVPARTIDGLKPLVVARPVPVAVDLNNDPLIRVGTLPGVGPVLAQELVAGRPYSGFEDLTRVKGFGPAKIDSLKGRVKFGKAEPAAKKDAPKAEPKKDAPKADSKKADAKPAREVNQPGAKVNLNTADLEQLDALPGIGQVRAQAIVAARPFRKIEDIMNIKGIKQVEFDKIKDQITVDK